MRSQIFLTWISILLVPPVAACRHSLSLHGHYVTIFEILLLTITCILLAILSFLIPRMAMIYSEIHEINTERRRRFNDYRKMQRAKTITANIPPHQLREYYEDDRNSSSPTKSPRNLVYLGD